MDERKMSEGQRAYEARRAAKAGMSLDRWLREREREAARAAQAPQAPTGAPAKKRGLLARLLERAQKPL